MFAICVVAVAFALCRVAEATAGEDGPQNTSVQGKVKAESETAQKLKDARDSQRSSSAYKSWKRRLPFWPRKAYLLCELGIIITIGVFVGQALEVSGLARLFAIFAFPLTWLGGLPKSSGPAFLMAFQSGAVANSMLVTQRDNGNLTARELYTAVLVVSCLSLSAHLPTFVVPIGMAFGWQATCALFGVRFVAIAAEIVAILLVSRWVIAKWTDNGSACIQEAAHPEEPETAQKKARAFWPTVWKRSSRTLRRLLLYLVPTFALMATLEYHGAFKWLADKAPGLFTLEFLPAQASIIVPAQALSLYNGAIAAANFIDSGALSVQQAVVVILFGSLITAPVRTLKHAFPTYVAILGPRAGLTMAVSAQVLRSLFLLACTLALMSIWT